MNLILVIATCVCIAAVDGRRQQKRSAGDEYDHKSENQKMMMRDENSSQKRINFDVPKLKSDDRMDFDAKLPFPEKTERNYKSAQDKKRVEKTKLNESHSKKRNIEEFRKRTGENMWDQVTLENARMLKKERMHPEKIREMLKDHPEAEHLYQEIMKKLEEEKDHLDKLHKYSTK